MGGCEALPPRGGGGLIVPATLVAVCLWCSIGATPWRASGADGSKVHGLRPAGSQPRRPARDRAPGPASPAAGTVPDSVVLFQPQSAAHLASVLDAAWKGVREEGTVPGIAPSALPHDMEHLDLETRKRTFLRSLAPHLLAVNKEIAADRRQLLAIARQLRHGAALPEGSVAFLGAACCRYGVPEAQERLAAGRAGAAVAHLLVHVDEVPLRLALAQAAVESAWGASRLAKEDKSLFGLSVEKAGKRPSARPGPGGLWYARYATLRDGVEAYVRNLNRFWAYEEFRKVRASMRRKGVPLSSLRLAGGLSPYSELGERYVAKVRAVIQGKEFTVFSQVRLAPLSPRPAVEAPGQVVPALALDRLHSVAGGNQGT